MNPPSQHLVFGDDGSAAADVVWLWINNHAWPGWRISVVTAEPPPPGPPVGMERSSPHPWNPPSPRQLLSAASVTQLEHLMAEADPRIVLDSFKDASLMAIGPRGGGTFKSLLIGSTAEWLVSAHRPLAPLVIIRSARPTRHVMLCVDGSAHAQRATQTLASLPWVGDAQVTILGVLDGSSDVERGVEDAATLLETRDGVRVERLLTGSLSHTATFDVRSTILDAIAEGHPDVVVLGTRGIGAFRRMVLGSTARAVLHHAPCSVLLARAPEHDVESERRPEPTR